MLAAGGSVREAASVRGRDVEGEVLKQVFLGGDGQIEVLEAPVPGRLRAAVLVRNAYSLISSGTEGAAVTRRGGIWGIYEKARGSRDRVEQVWSMARTQGIAATAHAVRGKLADYGMLGYSSAGIVVEVDGENMPYRPGDRVACMGVGFANHAEYVAVPRNLVARVPDGVALEDAAFGSLACIAMQGIRRLELTAGEQVVVIGLGLIGQLCARLLGAMGYRPLGLDRDPLRAAKAREGGVAAWALEETDCRERVRELTGGHGADGVVICAGTKSDEPVNLAFDLCRRNGRVSVVGDVGLGLQRAKMYRKELELRLSCSYGPGRYDDTYEIGGHDYPIEHARWTEGRNLGLFLQMLGSGRLSVADLRTDRFDVTQASQAYAKAKQGSSVYGVLLDYGPLPEEPRAPRAEQRVLHMPTVPRRANGGGRVRLGLIGVGGYAKGMHLPNLKALDNLFEVRAMASRSGGTAAAAAKRFGAEMVASDYRALLDDPELDAVLVCTRHSAHAKIVLDALDAGKHVFVEKPMTTTIEDGRAVVAKAKASGLVVRVGFNRRFSPFMSAMREVVGREGPRMFTIRCNIGPGAGHWSDTEEEGGRLLGEGVHFLDLCNWLVGGEPVSVTGVIAGGERTDNPSTMVQLGYGDGSTAQITYTALGHKLMGKEFYEAFGNGRSARCDDFRSVEAFGAPKTVKGKRGDKGQRGVLEEFAAAIRGEQHSIAGADARAGLVATALALAARRSTMADCGKLLQEVISGLGADAAEHTAAPVSEPPI